MFAARSVKAGDVRVEATLRLLCLDQVVKVDQPHPCCCLELQRPRYELLGVVLGDSRTLREERNDPFTELFQLFLGDLSLAQAHLVLTKEPCAFQAVRHGNQNTGQNALVAQFIIGEEPLGTVG